MELITVLMSTYNECEPDLRESIESILKQSYPHLQFVIVNDNPKNEMLSRVLEEYQNRDKRIQIVKNEKNMGLVESLNRGWRFASGEYIARMDADDISLPDRLEKQLAFLKDNGYDLVGAGMQHIDETGAVTTPLILFPETPQGIRKLTKKSNCVPHPTWLMKKNVVESLNGYRNIPHCEDFDFVQRAQNHGFSLGNMQSLGLYYRVRSQSISQSNWATQKLSAEYLAKNWKRIESCNTEELKTYLASRRSQRFYAFSACQTQIAADNAAKWQKVLRLFCRCWHNPFFWKFVCAGVQQRFIGHR